jgi:hypothetical protein
MAVDDGVDLVDAGRGLVDALRVERDDATGPRKQRVEGLDLRWRQVSGGCDGVD